ncbi:MAG: metalloregulator ArsR/SmtB family transcription factor [Sandaracinaceae bacterium]|nr:metalloregulator ArsR/SmtB family transcription factor [Sandaracinaceae bacterium]
MVVHAAQRASRHATEAELNQVFRALADTTRRDILRRTLAGEVSVSGLAEAYQMSFAAVQKHVAALEKARLVRKVAVGRQRLVRADPDEIARARACLQELEALWRHRMTALDAVLSSPEE